jgi:hypothetical protein
MKTICKIRLIGIFLLFFACISCNKPKPEEKDPPCDEISIADGWIINPQWLVSKLDSLNNLRGRYPWVYSIFHDKKTYILLYDGDAPAEGRYLYYTCFGKYEESVDLRNIQLFDNRGRRGINSLLWVETVDITCDNIVAADNRIQSPQWLVDEVERVRTSIRPPPVILILQTPWVYRFHFFGQEYIAVRDMSLFMDPSMFTLVTGYFTCSGVRILWGSLLFWELDWFYLNNLNDIIIITI